MAGEESGDKQHAATGRRLQEARAQGNVPLSHDLAGLASFATGLILLLVLGAYQASRLREELLYFFLAAAGGDATAGAALPHAVLLAACAAGPLVLAVLVAGLAATWLQTGFLFHLGAIGFDLSRLSPGRGFKRIFSGGHLVELIKMLAKLLVLGWAVGHVLWREVPAMVGALSWPIPALLTRLRDDLTRLVLALVLAQGAIVGADLLWVRFKHARDLRMSREEMRQEQKDSDGDPHIKRKRRGIMFGRTRRRIRAAIEKATVVVTNPTHFAVALAYEKGAKGAPRVVAKGADEIAANIRAMAAEFHVPLVANPPLARALYMVELDAEIPAEHFKAVAEIIAYVWRLNATAKTTVSKTTVL